MTSQGSPRGRFQRAIQRGSLFQAELTARELGALTLADALALTVLIGKEPERYGRAAVRQHGRFELEARRLDLWESQLALAGLVALPKDPDAAVSVPERIGERHGVRLGSSSAVGSGHLDGADHRASVSRDPARPFRTRLWPDSSESNQLGSSSLVHRLDV
jgi:hypothetical protein